MKLLYITNGINGPGGLERVLSVKASVLAEQYGYDVTILVFNNTHLNPFYCFSDKINFVSIPVHGSPIAYVKKWRKGIQHVINTIDPDIISVCDTGFKGFFLKSIIKTKAKWVYERHNSKLVEKTKNDSKLGNILVHVKWKVMDILGRKYDRFVVLTKENTKEWSNFANLEIIHNPLSFLPNERATLINKQVICVGKIGFQKGQDMLIKAWTKVYKVYPNWQLHLYGEEDLNFLDTNNLKDNVHYFKPEKNIQEKYLESSIYVMSSRYEGFGMVLTEALACGLPCVSFNCNYGPSDIITDEEDGFLVEKNNIEELAERIILLMSDLDLRKKMGESAKENVKRFSNETIVHRWDTLFKSLFN